MRLLSLGADVLASNCTVTVPGSLRHLKALNTLIQGGAANVMKAIAVAVYERRPEVPGLEIVGLVHDEILATVPDSHAAAAAALVYELMKEVGEEVTNIGVDEDKRVPIDAATQVCDSWAEKE